ncbi:MAG: FAD-dependent oxidoreductase [Hyphomicrobiaceae bacterium]|nr:FAD-dependent oxidoreductase [Hyphomicrobiaceae bacterium]
MTRLNIAVIGSGISGLSAAWLLSQRHRVTLYEADDRLGGHANTVDVETPEGQIPVDTGFIVYNEQNYPNLTALFRHLGVATEPTEMSFALSLDNGDYEYAGSGFTGFFGQRRNLINPAHWRLLRDVSRFFRTAPDRIADLPPGTTLGDFLSHEDYSDEFVENHIMPMGAAIWSTPMASMLGFPARSFINFYANHGMLQFRERPAWRTVTGGSRTYVDRLIDDGGFEVTHGTTIERVVRHDRYVHIVDARGVMRPFDHVVIAAHADQALKMIDEPHALEARHLGQFDYEPNRAVLHTDRRWMPQRKRLWSSWNYLKNGTGHEQRLSLSYWMNRLQNLKTKTNLFVTLNPTDEIHPKAVIERFNYTHPIFNAAAIIAQKQLWNIQGLRRTWFCGSYFGYGFHEDGLQSGLAVAEQLGGMRRPWRVENESGRIALPQEAVRIEAAE